MVGMRIGKLELKIAAEMFLGLCLAACGGGSSKVRDAADSVSVMTVGSENITIVDSMRLERGPVISGNLAPERRADIKAQVTGTVLQVYVEPGQKVARGALLARIEAAGIREAYVSAQSAVRSAEATLEVARRNYERSQRLAEAGAIADRDLESAQTAVTNAEAALADAQARLSNAGRQLSNTELRSPFTGIVSERPANAGDVVQLGTAMVTVVDPTSMRLDASVPTDQLALMRIGAPVNFTVTGYPGRLFTGQVERVNPAVDPTTRQVRIYVRIPNTRQTLVAGLYAEGRVAAESRMGLAVPLAALDTTGRASVLRLRNGRVERVPVDVGLRDDVAERVEVTLGLSQGDTLLLDVARGLTPGVQVRVAITRTQAADSTQRPR